MAESNIKVIKVANLLYITLPTIINCYCGKLSRNYLLPDYYPLGVMRCKVVVMTPENVSIILVNRLGHSPIHIVCCFSRFI